jgi:hypothetical protein
MMGGWMDRTILKRTINRNNSRDHLVTYHVLSMMVVTVTTTMMIVEDRSGTTITAVVVQCSIKEIVGGTTIDPILMTDLM